VSNDRSPDLSRDMQHEHAWLVGLRAGDVSAYRNIFEAYVPRLWRFARMSVPSAVAEDIVQDVLFDLWNRRDTIEVRDGLAPYLLGAVRKRVWQYLRHERIEQRTEVTNADAPLAMSTPEPGPDDVVAANDLKTAALQALNGLSELQRAVLVLRWTHELSYEQIAATLSISVEAARQHVSRTQRVVRPLLERYRVEP
jgi:RNA polymerase sigma-70 factor (ECF subfamily)